MLESVKQLKAALESASSVDEVPESLLHNVVTEEVQRIVRAVGSFNEIEIPFLMAALRFVALQLIVNKENGEFYESTARDVLTLLRDHTVSIVVPAKRSEPK